MLHTCLTQFGLIYCGLFVESIILKSTMKSKFRPFCHYSLSLLTIGSYTSNDNSTQAFRRQAGSIFCLARLRIIMLSFAKTCKTRVGGLFRVGLSFQCGSAAHDFRKLGGNGCLSCPVVRNTVGAQQFVCIIGGFIHRAHSGAMF